MSDNGARRSGDQIAAGEGVMEFKQRAAIRNGEAVVSAAIDGFLRGSERLPVELFLILRGIGSILRDGLLDSGLRSRGIVNFSHHFP